MYIRVFETASGRWEESRPYSMTNPNSSSLTEVIECMKPAALVQHVTNVHVWRPLILRAFGVRYDAELAALCGVSLQPAADSARMLLEVIDTYKKQPRHRPQLDDFVTHANPQKNSNVTAADLAGIEDYPDTLANSIRQMTALEVASTGGYPKPLVSDIYRARSIPSSDSFFDAYGIRRLRGHRGDVR